MLEEPRRSRVVLAAVSALALLAGLRGAEAHTGVWATCPAAKSPLVIDGDMAEWTEAPVRVGPERRTFGKVLDAADASFTWRAQWDGQFLYVGVEVGDDQLQFDKDRDKVYENDCVEICIDARNDGLNVYGTDDFQFVFSPSGPAGKPQKRLFRNPLRANLDPPEVKFAARLREKGYSVEAAIPWKTLGLQPRPNMVLGFDVDLRDYDPKQEAKGLSWSGTGDVCGDPMLWGDLILVSDPREQVQPLVEDLRKADDARRAKLARMDRPEETENAVTLTVSPDPVGALTLGMGWNWVYRADDLWDWDEETWKSFFELMRWSGCRWVRYGVHGDQWEPANDDNDPNHFNWAGFTFDSPMMRQHCRSLDLCEKAGIAVLICGWRPPRWQYETKPYRVAPKDADEFIESITALLHQLVVAKGYKCVRYVSLWNEPNWSYGSTGKTYPETFWAYYPLLDKRLRAVGLRDKIGILGPDTSMGGKSLGHFMDMLKLHAPLLDVIADHDYEDYLEYKPVKRGTPMGQGVSAYAQLARDARALYGRRVPVAITEFGNYGNGSRFVDDDDAVFEGSLSTAELVLRLANAGLDGFLRWEFRVGGAVWRNFGALTDTDPAFVFKPYGPVYYPASLLSRYATPGSSVLACKMEGGCDENGAPRVVASAFRLPDGNLTVLLVNDGFLPKQAKLSFPDDKVKGLRRLCCSGEKIHSLEKAADVTVTGKECALTLKPRSIIALTTIAKGTSAEDLAFPEALAVRRQEPRYLVDEKTGQKGLEFTSEHGGVWTMWKNSEGKSSFARSSEQAHEGRFSGKYVYDFSLPAPHEQIIPSARVRLEKMPDSISLWVCGDGSGHELSLILGDSKGESFHRPLAPVTWTGWRRVDRALDDMPKGWGHWGKNADGNVDLPLALIQLPLTESDKSPQKTGAIYIDEVRLTEMTR